MTNRTTTWNVVLALLGSPNTSTSHVSAPWWEAACEDTLDAVLATVDPRNLSVLTNVPRIAAAARAAGAHTDEPGRDLNTDLSAAMARSAARTGSTSGLMVIGPLPYLTPQTFFSALRACAAVESAVIVADDGGTIALSHHDAARLTPRFGGASSARHERTAVRVGEQLHGLQRQITPGKPFPGRHLASHDPSESPATTRKTHE